VGEKLFPEYITLPQQSVRGRQPSSPWSGDLLPSKAVTWIDKGVVANLAYDRYWAAKTGKEPTGGGGGGTRGGGGGGGGFGGGEGALTLDGGDASTEALIASVERGLLITHFWYIRGVNPQTLQQTGLTRDGVFLIENGKDHDPRDELQISRKPGTAFEEY